MTWPIYILSTCLLLSSLYIWRLMRVIRRLKLRASWYAEQSLGHIERTIAKEEARWTEAYEQVVAKKQEVRALLGDSETPEAETD
jgi:hypothetical protein